MNADTSRRALFGGAGLIAVAALAKCGSTPAHAATDDAGIERHWSARCAAFRAFEDDPLTPDDTDRSNSYGPDWWLPIYRRAFPTLMSAVAVEHDGWAQRGGIDRLLTLACGRTYTVDEKIRTEDWPDVLLERWSDEVRKSPGWVQKPLAADFIAYAHAPAATCVLMPVAALQRAWRQHGRSWIGLYGLRRAQNAGWTSVSVPVPRGVLMQAIVEAMFVT